MSSISVAEGSILEPNLSVDAIAVNLFYGVTRPGGGTGAVDRATGSLISMACDQRWLKGGLGELTTFRSTRTKPVMVLGLGDSDRFHYDQIMWLTEKLTDFAAFQGYKSFGTIAHGAGIGGKDPEQVGKYMRFGYLKSKASEDVNLVIVEQSPDVAAQLIRGIFADEA